MNNIVLIEFWRDIKMNCLRIEKYVIFKEYKSKDIYD